MKDKKIEQKFSEIESNFSEIKKKLSLLETCLNAVAYKAGENDRELSAKLSEKEGFIFILPSVESLTGHKTETIPLSNLKSGDWVRNRRGGNVGEVVELLGRWVRIKDEDIIYLSLGEDLELYTPKEGEYFYCENRLMFVGIKNKSAALTGCYTTICLDNFNVSYNGVAIVDKSINLLRPATPDEIKQLDDALLTQGKKWDAEKKQLVDIPQESEEPKEPKVGDIVIVREHMFPKEHAKIGILEDISQDSCLFRYKMNGKWYFEAIVCESLEQYKQYLQSPR